MIQLTPQEISQYKGQMYLDMSYFGQVCFPETCIVKPPPVHYEIYDALQNYDIKRLLVVIPRGCAKTTIDSLIFPLYDVLLRSAGEYSVIPIISKTQQHSIKSLRTIRLKLDDSSMIRAIFGDWSHNTFKKDTETQIILKDNSLISALGMGQMIHGFKHGDRRPNIIVCDDLNTDDNVKTPESRDAGMDWLLGGVEPALASDGRLIVLGTMIHEDCIVNRLKDAKGWHVIWYGSTIDADTKQVLWPEMYSWKWLKEKEESYHSMRKSHVYYMQYENKIVGSQDSLFKPEDIQYYEGETEFKEKHFWLKLKRICVNGTWKDTNEIIPLNVFFGIDPAGSTAEGRDYTVIMATGIAPDKRRFVLEIFRKRIAPYDIAKAILEMFTRLKPQRINVESVGFSGLIGDILSELMQEKKTFAPIYKVPVTVGKSEKYRESISGDFARKKVFMLESMRSFKDELMSFPRGHDDTIDAYWLSTRSAYPPMEQKYDDKKRKTEKKKFIDWRAI